jgi:hypothetical protein
MRRTAMLWEVFVTRFQEAFERYEKHWLSSEEAGELLGMSGRNFRRLCIRYEEDGIEGCAIGKVSRILIWPEASSAQNSIAAVSADGSTVCVLILRLNSSCSRSIAFVTGMTCAGSRRQRQVRRRSLGSNRDRGARSTEGGQVERTMGCEPELVTDRPCDLPGCAASADP